MNRLQKKKLLGVLKMVDQGRIIVQNFGLCNLWNDCKTLIFGRHFIWQYKQKSPKYETMKNSFEFSYTMSNKLTHILSMLIS